MPFVVRVICVIFLCRSFDDQEWYSFNDQLVAKVNHAYELRHSYKTLKKNLQKS